MKRTLLLIALIVFVTSHKTKQQPETAQLTQLNTMQKDTNVFLVQTELSKQELITLLGLNNTLFDDDPSDDDVDDEPDYIERPNGNGVQKAETAVPQMEKPPLSTIIPSDQAQPTTIQEHKKQKHKHKTTGNETQIPETITTSTNGTSTTQIPTVEEIPPLPIQADVPEVTVVEGNQTTPVVTQEVTATTPVVQEVTATTQEAAATQVVQEAAATPVVQEAAATPVVQEVTTPTQPPTPPTTPEIPPEPITKEVTINITETIINANITISNETATIDTSIQNTTTLLKSEQRPSLSIMSYFPCVLILFAFISLFILSTQYNKVIKHLSFRNSSLSAYLPLDEPSNLTSYEQLLTEF